MHAEDSKVEGNDNLNYVNHNNIPDNIVSSSHTIAEGKEEMTFSKDVLNKEYSVSAVSEEAVEKDYSVSAVSNEAVEKEYCVSAVSNEAVGKEHSVSAVSKEAVEFKEGTRGLESAEINRMGNIIDVLNARKQMIEDNYARKMV